MDILNTYPLMCMNTNGPTQKGFTDYRKRSIEETLISEEPLVVFAQEFKWKNLLSRAWSDISIPGYYKYHGHNEAGMIFDTRYVEVTRLDNLPFIRQVYDQMQRNSQYFSEFFEISRVCICRVRLKAKPNIELLCVSWHGPHKVAMDRKCNTLRTLLNFLQKIKTPQETLIVGGDFNLKSSIVRQILPPSFEMYSPNDESIDMFLATSGKVNSTIVELSTVEQLELQLGFDHCHLKIAISLTPAEDQTGGSEKDMPEVYNPFSTGQKFQKASFTNIFESMLHLIVLVLILLAICVCPTLSSYWMDLYMNMMNDVYVYRY